MAASNAAKKVVSCTCRFVKIVCAWKMKFLKTRFQGFKHWRARRTMDERVGRLGSEVYSLHRQGETELLRSQLVQQQLRLVEEAEQRLIAISDRIDAIEEDYRRKRREIAGSEEDTEE
ncbi:MAG: hypothetical protein AAGU11_00240 [Syntrophobacteraceae bacterium]